MFDDNLKIYYQDLLMPGGYNHNLPDTLQRIEAYYNGNFLSGERDEQGQRKIFYNISKPTCDVAEKFVDLDTKNITFIPEVGGIGNHLLIMLRRFKYWLKKNTFGVLLNEMGHNYPKYGHLVARKGNDKKWKLVNLQNLRTHPGFESLKESPFVYELMRMSYEDIEKMDWNKKDEIKMLKDDDVNDYLVYMCLERSGNKWNREIKVIDFRKPNGAKTTETEYIRKKNTEKLPEKILHEDTLSKFPYRELKWENVPGRWLGLGFMELLFPEQIRINELVYLKGKSLYLKALQLFFSKDENIGDNVITDMDFGTIIHTYDTPQQLRRDNVDLSAYNQEEARLDMSVSRKTHNTDIAMGENLPARTPLGLGQLQASMTISYFKKKKQKFGLFVKDILYEDEFPEFKKLNRGEHDVLIPKSEEGYDALVKSMVEDYEMKTLKKNYKKNGTVLAWSEIKGMSDRYEEKLRSQKELEYKVPKGFYDNLKAYIDIVITGESIDTKAKYGIYQFALSTIASNPQILVSPITRKLFFKLIEQTGEPTATLDFLINAAENTNPETLPQNAGRGIVTPPLPNSIEINQPVQV